MIDSVAVCTVPKEHPYCSGSLSFYAHIRGNGMISPREIITLVTT